VNNVITKAYIKDKGKNLSIMTFILTFVVISEILKLLAPCRGLLRLHNVETIPISLVEKLSFASCFKQLNLCHMQLMF